ncbi:CvpA family protein [Sphingomonas sp. KC8]|uniref:CvpA family protein n=1 Tax=Sphingomonas sp. KC8 TaxID=1030157 RepID=UPI000248855A|nr:CvpA family protein [Sphingomonas sp. KC8]ARS26322.1 colicin V production protein [Sphingomonas sp. KC8]
MNLTALDIIVLILMGGGAVMGGLRGFVAEMLSLFAWVAAIIAVKIAHGPVTEWLAAPVGTHMGAAVLAFALIFISVFVTGKLLAARMGQQTRQSVLGPVDRVLGFGFGGVKGLILAALLFLAANLASDVISGASSERPEWMRDSRTFPLLNASSRAIVDFVEMRSKNGGAGEKRADKR